jgi:hypothetical protein
MAEELVEAYSLASSHLTIALRLFRYRNSVRTSLARKGIYAPDSIQCTQPINLTSILILDGRVRRVRLRRAGLSPRRSLTLQISH